MRGAKFYGTELRWPPSLLSPRPWVENFRPDVKAKLGIDFESLRKINPCIVYGSISGFGQDDPYYKRPRFDQIAQSMGGLTSVTGAPGEGPMRAGWTRRAGPPSWYLGLTIQSS